MTMICQVTGKKAMKGNKISHSNRKTIKHTQPNLQSRRIFDPSTGTYVRLRLSTSAIRDIDKRGAEVVLKELRAKGTI